MWSANSLIRSRPASEERSPPSKLILNFLLLSRATVDKLDIERAPFLLGLWFGRFKF